MSFPLPPNATIGLVGGGQLGRMSALAAARLGYRCHILTRERDSPAGQVSAGVTISDYHDPAALRAFAAAVDVISFEFENINAEGLDLLASLKPVRPAPGILRISQDRVVEKTFLNGVGVPTAPWRAVASLDDLRAAVGELGLPAVLKTTRLGYDGKGQAPAAPRRRPDCRLRRVGAEAADPGGLRRFRPGDQRRDRARRGWQPERLRHGGESPSRAYPGPHAGARPRAGRRRRAVPGHRADHRRRARPGRPAGGGDVRRCHRPGAGQRDRAAAAQFRPLDDRCLPGQPVRAAYPRDRRPAAAGRQRATPTR